MAPKPQETLALKLKERIRRDGPMSVRDYMSACLQDPEYGYYRRGTVIGAAADFTTAPEISQVFGELIGIWAAVAWRAMGAPARLDLVELGPGRGTLMKDVLRASRIVPGFLNAAHVSLIESNVTLQHLQAETLQDVPVSLNWHPDLASATIRGPAAASSGTIVIANEFLDAIPVRQLVSVEGAWHERCVGLNDRGQFRFIPGAPVDAALLRAEASSARDGDIFELRPDLRLVIQKLAEWSGAGPLAALFIDYGHERTSLGDTLQAVKQQNYVSPLEEPGEADLTAHVDFEELSLLCRAAGLEVDGPIPQSAFLLGLGLAERTEQLMRAARTDQISLLETGARRLADPIGMGGRFKVTCVRSGNVPLLPPFAPA